MSKFQVGDKVECHYKVYGMDIVHRGVIVSTTFPVPTEYNYTVQEEDGKPFRYKESELTLINESFENV